METSLKQSLNYKRALCIAINEGQDIEETVIPPTL